MSGPFSSHRHHHRVLAVDPVCRHQAATRLLHHRIPRHHHAARCHGHPRGLHLTRAAQCRRWTYRCVTRPGLHHRYSLVEKVGRAVHPRRHPVLHAVGECCVLTPYAWEMPRSVVVFIAIAAGHFDVGCYFLALSHSASNSSAVRRVASTSGKLSYVSGCGTVSRGIAGFP